MTKLTIETSEIEINQAINGLYGILIDDYGLTNEEFVSAILSILAVNNQEAIDRWQND